MTPFALLSILITCAFARDGELPRIARRLRCLNESHWERVYSFDDERAPPREAPSGACRFGFRCVRSGGGASDSCRGATLASHLLRGADYQIVESVDASQLSQCSASHGDDVAAGLMLCDVLHSTREAPPTFGHILGNTWLHFGFGPGDRGSAAPCNATPAAWRACYGANLAAQASALTAAAPELLISGGLMEFLDAANLDDTADFPDSACVPGSVGQWGAPSTCVPDVRRAPARAYYGAWGRVFLDAGIRAIFFGQARLTGGSAPDGSDDVDPAGAEGFAAVIADLRAYASARGYGDIYFAPQAAAAITLANGTNVADWVYGAQHLEPHSTQQLGGGGFLTQPTLQRGSYIPAAIAQYGAGDMHEASRSNAGGRNGSQLPTV